MKAFKNFGTVFFDLDGTLSDSQQGIIRCIQYSLAKFGIEENDIEKLRCYIGPSLAETYRDFYGFNDEQIKQATEYYRERFERDGVQENEMFDGVLELILALKKQNKKLVLATAKPTVHAAKIIEYYQIKQYFSGIFGSNLDGTREEKSEVIAYALASMPEISRDDIVMVGDRKHDILGAKENGLAVIGVGYGYGTIDEIKESKPDFIAYTVEELKNILTGN